MIDTLKRGFELGVSLVHTAPDYEGADALVAEAIGASGRDVLDFARTIPLSPVTTLFVE